MLVYDFMENVINTFPDAKKYFSIRKFKSGKKEKEIPTFNFKKAALEGAIDINVPIDIAGKTISVYRKHGRKCQTIMSMVHLKTL
jgi:hypothetical protein